MKKKKQPAKKFHYDQARRRRLARFASAELERFTEQSRQAAMAAIDGRDLVKLVMVLATDHAVRSIMRRR